MKGSPTWTEGRFSSRVSSNTWLASTLAPPMPSRPGLGADQHHVVAHPRRAAADDLVLLHQTHRHGVDQAVAGVGVFEVDLAGHRGDAHAVAVAADAGHHVLEEVALAVERPLRWGRCRARLPLPRRRRGRPSASRAGSGSISPNRRESRPQMGRAPWRRCRG